MTDSVITSRARLLALRCAPAATTPTMAAAGRRATDHQRAVEGKTASSARPSQILLRGVGGVQSLANLRLQPRLLVQADFEVREDGELRTLPRVVLEPRAFVPGERLAQVALPLGWVARPQSVEETLQLRGVGLSVRRALVKKARELEADLLEHLQVSARDGVARTLERIERRVQRGRQTPDPRVALEEAAPQQPTPRRCDWMQQPTTFAEFAPEVLQEILSADRPPRLSRGPCGVRAPVRALAASCCKCRGEARVAVSDLEVSDDGVRDRRDLPDVVHIRCGRSVGQVMHTDKSTRASRTTEAGRVVPSSASSL